MAVSALFVRLSEPSVCFLPFVWECFACVREDKDGEVALFFVCFCVLGLYRYGSRLTGFALSVAISMLFGGYSEPSVCFLPCIGGRWFVVSLRWAWGISAWLSVMVL